LDGTNALITCLSHHQYHGCGYTGRLNDAGLMSPMADWPLLQHVPDLISIGFGAESHPTRTRVFEALNIVSVVGSIALAWLVLTRARRAPWFWGFVLLVISSPLLWYARNTANEGFASGLIVALVASTLIPAPPVLVGLAAAAASVTKETAYPFVIVLGVLGLVLARRRTGQSIRPHLIWGAAGVVVAFIATSLFNIIRYDSIWNRNLLDSTLHTHGVHVLAHFAGVFVSPSGGLFVFWPAAGVLIATACVLAWRRRRELDGRPALVVGLVVLVLAIGFASWWSPFGWSAYGPRFLLPWMLPLSLIVIVAYGEALTGLTRRVLAAPWRLALVFAVVFLFALPNIGEMWRPTSVAGFFEHRNCQAPWFVGESGWYACEKKEMWSDRPMPIYALHGLRSAGGIATAVLVGASLLGCLLLMREGDGYDARCRSRTDRRSADRTDASHVRSQRTAARPR
jgi:hypothetical protein